jgi:hypothetical protein
MIMILIDPDEDDDGCEFLYLQSFMDYTIPLTYPIRRPNVL